MTGLPRCDVCPTGRGSADDLIDFWAEGSAFGSVPGRGHFDPLRLKPWLGYLSIYECRAGAVEYFNRLEGSEVTRLTGECWQGRTASEVDLRFGSRLLEDLKQTASARRPMRSRVRLFQRPLIVVDRLLLPVAVRGPGVDQVFVALLPLHHDR